MPRDKQTDQTRHDHCDQRIEPPSVDRDVVGRKRAEDELRRQNDMLSAAAHIGRLLLDACEPRTCLDEALRLLGEASGQDRAYYFERLADSEVDRNLFCLSHEWTRQGVSPQRNHPAMQALPFAVAVPMAWQCLSMGQDFCARVRDVPPGQREILEEQDILALLLVPVMVDGVTQGVLGFDDCTEECRWTDSDRSTLTIVASGIGSVVRRRRMEILSHENAARSQLALEVAQLGHWRYDCATHAVEWYSGHDILFGISHEMFGRNIDAVQEMVHPDDRAHGMEKIRKTVESGVPFDNTYRVVHPDGSIHWLHSYGYLYRAPDGRPLHISGVTQNITQHKNDEFMLQISEVKYRTLFEMLPVGITVSDPEGRIVDSNRAAEKLLGIAKGEHAKRKIDGSEWHIVRPDGTNMPADEFPSSIALKQRRLVENVDLGIDTAPDSIRWLNVTAAPIPLEGFGVAIAYSDITARKEVECELERQRNKLRELADDLTQSEERQRRKIALRLHDGVGQILSVAKMKLREAETSADSPTRAQELVAIRKTIEQALDDTRSLTLELTPPLLYDAGLVPALEWLVEHFQKNHPSIQFHFDGHSEPAAMECRLILFQIARELLYNVVKHAKARNAWVRLDNSQGQIRMQVRDDGVGGISPSTPASSHLEDGFGLFSIQERIRLHGGSVAIDSPPGLGTAVTIGCPQRHGD